MKYDKIIKNGKIVDGSNSPAYYADVAIQGDRIAAIGHFRDEDAEQILDAAGCVVCPGFIDNHSHGDLSLMADPHATNFVAQGITTEMTGNCGLTLAPARQIPQACRSMMISLTPDLEKEILSHTETFSGMMDYFESLPMGINMGCYAGQGTIREMVMGFDPSVPNKEQMAEMCSYMEEAMQAGAFGLSSGLIYPTGSFSEAPEIAEVCKVVRAHDGVYCTHMRNEGDLVDIALQEAIETAELSGVKLVISHHKVTGAANRGRSAETLKMIDEAAARGVDIHMDQYPYDSGSTPLICTIPKEMLGSGMGFVVEQLKTREYRDRIMDFVFSGQHNTTQLLLRSIASPADIMIGSANHVPEIVGKNLVEIGELWNTDPYEALFDVIVKTEGTAVCVIKLTPEEDIERIFSHPRTMVGTDGLHGSKFNAMGHPRLTATFTRAMAHYARDKKLVSLEEAVHKCTGLPAKVIGLKDRGLLKEGMFADIVVMDYDHLESPADYISPSAPNKGMRYVLINGTVALKDDVPCETLSGRLIRH